MEMITGWSPAPQASLDYCAVRDRTVYSSLPGTVMSKPLGVIGKYAVSLVAKALVTAPLQGPNPLILGPW
jgi:hypothetical protein